MKSIRYFLFSFSILVVLVLTAACGSTKSPDPTATSVPPIEPTLAIHTPTATVTLEPTATATEIPPTATEVILPTNTSVPPTAVPTAIPQPTEPESLPYYIEEFDTAPENWTWFMMNGEEKDMDVYTEDGYLVFDLQGENQWVYLLYDDYVYKDVYLETMADNRGKNNNNVSLICRYTEDEGWYEFNITNGGLYQILVYSEPDQKYFLLADGGSVNINSGKATNIYSAVCWDNELELYINGVLEREITDTQYNLREGQVGISVSSFTSLPILVEFDYVWIDTPY